MSKLAVRYTWGRRVRRLLFACALLGELVIDGVKSSIRRDPKPEPFTFTPKDVYGEPPGVATWGPGRWTKGGDA